MRTAAADHPAARRMMAAGSVSPSAKQCAIAATAASPAPVGLPASTRGSRARQSRPGSAAVSNSMPCSPRDTRIIAAPRSSSTRAPRTASCSPVASASSSRFGLSAVAPARAEARSAGPDVSITLGRPRALAKATRLGKKSTLAPGGRLPQPTRQAALGSTSSMAPDKASHSATVWFSPYSLRIVV